MNDKSHVSLEQHVCLVCGTRFDTGAILLDRRLRASMERHTATGWGLCPEHQKLSDEGFVALVECDPQYGIHRLVKQVKGRSSRVLRQEFDSLRSRLPTLWTNSYFVATVGGAPLAAIKEYVANQRNV